MYGCLIVMTVVGIVSFVAVGYGWETPRQQMQVYSSYFSVMGMFHHCGVEGFDSMFHIFPSCGNMSHDEARLGNTRSETLNDGV